jgi:hypothetical protein
VAPAPEGRAPKLTTTIGVVSGLLAIAAAVLGVVTASHAVWVNSQQEYETDPYVPVKVPVVLLVLALAEAGLSIRLLPRGNAQHWIGVLSVAVACCCVAFPVLLLAALVLHYVLFL